MLIEYLAVAGLVEREGTQLRATKGEPAALEPVNGGRLEKEEVPPTREPATIQAPIFAAPPTQNRIEFAVTISVNMAEMAGWDAARISAFFAGLAQVLAARGRED